MNHDGRIAVRSSAHRHLISSMCLDRAALEIRLRSMWSKISEEMTALAEERGDEVVVREEIMSWMDQVPTVLQDIISKKEVSPSHDVRLRSEKEMIKPHDVPRIVNEGHSGVYKWERNLHSETRTFK